MSHATNIVIQCDRLDAGILGLPTGLDPTHPERPMDSFHIDPGTPYNDGAVWYGLITSHVHTDRLAELAELDWSRPKNVRLFLSGEDGEDGSTYQIVDGRWVRATTDATFDRWLGLAGQVVATDTGTPQSPRDRLAAANDLLLTAADDVTGQAEADLEVAIRAINAALHRLPG